ncbi:MAG: putative sugar O-methyltransferase [Actinomycetota bacterium]|nr:putative sugar O-methyltransferase [Actinomycetota bacterium]
MTNTGRGRVNDDPELLELMIEDWHQTGARGELTGNLVDFYDSFAQSLREESLKTNIGLAIRGITGVNGCDLPPSQRTLARMSQDPSMEGILEIARNLLTFTEQNPEAKVFPYELSLDDLNHSAFRICELYGQLHGAASIRDIEMSEAHYPEYVFSVDAHNYSYIFLYSYISYVYCSRFVDFDTIDNVIELGPGAGRQVEVIKKYHPKLNFYLVDLAPTLYLCYQYLSSIFTDDIVPYRSTREHDLIQLTDKQQLAFVGNGDIGRVSPVGTNLSICSAVLGLMSPINAAKYLDELSVYSDYIFMIESRGDDSKGTYSLDDSACLDDFERIFDGKYDLVHREAAFYPLSVREGFGGFEMMMWAKS